MVEQLVREMQAKLASGDDQKTAFSSFFRTFLASFQPGTTVISIDQSATLPLPTWQVQYNNQLIGYIDIVSSKPAFSESEEDLSVREYISTFDNLLLLNSHEFRLYRQGEMLMQADISVSLFDALPEEATTGLHQLPEKVLSYFFRFRTKQAASATELAKAAAKWAKLLSKYIQRIFVNNIQEDTPFASLLETIQKKIDPTLTYQQFADQYAQAFILHTLQSTAFINPPAPGIHHDNAGNQWDEVEQSFQDQTCYALHIVEDEIKPLIGNDSLKAWWDKTVATQRTSERFIDFYRMFRSSFDEAFTFRNGIDETTYPLANYITKAVHQLVKTQLLCYNGLADERIRVIHPASSFCNLMNELMKLTARTYMNQFGFRRQPQLFEQHIQPHFIAFEHRLDAFAWGAVNTHFVAADTSFIVPDQPFQHFLLSPFFQETKFWHEAPSDSEYASTFAAISEQPLPIIICNTFQLYETPLFNKQLAMMMQKNPLNLPRFSEVEGKQFPTLQPGSLQESMVAMIWINQYFMTQHGQGVSALIVPQKLLHHPDFRGVRSSLMQTMNEIYILDLHGSTMHDEHVPDGSHDEHVFDDDQGVAVLFLVKRFQQSTCKIYHADLLGSRYVKENWLKHTDFELYTYQPINPSSPHYVFSPYDIHAKQSYQAWKSLNEIMPAYETLPILTENIWIDQDKTQLIERLLDRQAKQQRFMRYSTTSQEEKTAEDFEKQIISIRTGLFEEKFVYIPDDATSEEYNRIAHHFEHTNKALVISQNLIPGKGDLIFSVFAVNHFVTHPFLSTRPIIGEYLFPLHLYQTTNATETQPVQTVLSLFEQEENYVQSTFNFDKNLLKQLATGYGKKVDAGTLFDYIYAILWSNHYKAIAAQHQTNSIPRIPFPMDRAIFDQLALKGRQCMQLHLQNSFSGIKNHAPQYNANSDNNRIERVFFVEKESAVYINSTNYFEPVSVKQWQFAIGDNLLLHQVLSGKTILTESLIQQFCATASYITDNLHLIDQIDGLFDEAIITTFSFNG